MSIVKIKLDCGHTRTWNTSYTKDRYSKKDVVTCAECSVKENIHQIIDKSKQGIK